MFISLSMKRTLDTTITLFGKQRNPVEYVRQNDNGTMHYTDYYRYELVGPIETYTIILSNQDSDDFWSVIAKLGTMKISELDTETQLAPPKYELIFSLLAEELEDELEQILTKLANK